MDEREIGGPPGQVKAISGPKKVRYRALHRTRLSLSKNEFVACCSQVLRLILSIVCMITIVIQRTRTRRRCTQRIGLQRGTSKSEHSFASFHFFHSHFLPARFLPPNRRPFSRPDSLRFALFPCSSPVPIHGSSSSSLTHFRNLSLLSLAPFRRYETGADPLLIRLRQTYKF